MTHQQENNKYADVAFLREIKKDVEFFRKSSLKKNVTRAWRQLRPTYLL